MPKPPVKFKQADVKRAIRAAQSEGLPVTGFEITPEGGLRIMTAAAATNSADAALAAWQQGRSDG